VTQVQPVMKQNLMQVFTYFVGVTARCVV